LLLLNQLSPETCNLSAIDASPEERAKSVVDMAKAFGCDFFLSTASINKGISKMNLLYLAAVFNVKHGLVLEESHEKFAELIQFDAEGSREERGNNDCKYESNFFQPFAVG
jgi:hypothetical protein